SLVEPAVGPSRLRGRLLHCIPAFRRRPSSCRLRPEIVRHARPCSQIALTRCPCRGPASSVDQRLVRANVVRSLAQCPALVTLSLCASARSSRPSRRGDFAGRHAEVSGLAPAHGSSVFSVHRLAGDPHRHFSFAQRRSSARPPRSLLRALLRSAAPRDGYRSQLPRLSRCSCPFRCYTFRRVLFGDFPHHLSGRTWPCGSSTPRRSSETPVSRESR